MNKRLEEVRHQYRQGNLSRRDFVKYLGVAGVAAGLVGGPFGLVRNAMAQGRIRFDGWGGTTSQAFRRYAFEPFTSATGIRVVDGEFGDMDSYLTRVIASFPPGGEFNLAHLSGVFDYARYVGLEFNTALDESKIGNLELVMEAMIEPYRRITPEALSAVPYNLGQTGIAYNTKYISEEKAEELGASLLWDDSIRGNLGSWVEWRTNIWYAALYTGQDPNNIQDINAVWDALRKQVPMVRKYWGSGAELMNLLASEEVYATVAWSGRVAHLQEQGYPIGFLAPEGCYSWQECIFVMKGTDLDVAHQLLDFMLAPEASIAVAEGQMYPPSLDPTKVELTEKIKNLPAFDPTGKLQGYLFADPHYWNERQLEWAERWDRVRAGR
ncbi:extracellular solute-binding protein [Desulfonatronovibrio hydrogenovorans]|uniref:extracellular solute-binding protein n=1 Tax=Desulfonatronovibrio hydrogenovorans TaxID=53245 RepID=UPI00048C8572|nr:extracellular solute-binding protein [Desulfonatronovibrio hydrogenovorans]